MLIDYADVKNPLIISFFGVYMDDCYEIAISKNNNYAFIAGKYGLRILPV
jgi:hypothetical protein